MKRARDRLCRVHAWMCACYPHAFRRDFSSEMRSVFRERLEDSLARGGWAPWRACWSELRDWPTALARAYGSALAEHLGMGIMNLLSEDRHWAIADRRSAVLAALPPLLLGGGIALGALVVRDPWYQVPRWRLLAGVLSVLFPALVVALVGAFALLRRLPAWGYAWAGAAGMGALMFVKTLAEERADEGLPLLSPAIDLLIAALLAASLAFLLAYAAWRGWRQAGLLSLGFATVVGLFTLGSVSAAPFNRYDLAALAAPGGLLMSALCYLYVRKGDLGRLGAIGGYALLNTLGLLVARSVWGPWLAARELPSPVLPVFVVLMGAVLAGPLAGAVGRPLRRVIHGS